MRLSELEFFNAQEKNAPPAASCGLFSFARKKYSRPGKEHRADSRSSIFPLIFRHHHHIASSHLDLTLALPSGILDFMKSFFCSLLAGLALITMQAHARAPNALESSTQVLVVTTPDWNAVEGTLQRYERATPHKKWQAVGEPITVVVGKNGLGWGSGTLLTNSAEVRAASDPIKKEGDGKAPAGVFALGTVFGYAPQPLAGLKMPYQNLTASIECVDDTSSKFYNRLVDHATVTADWNSSEHMLRPDELYRWGIFVDHNANPPTPASASCIFLPILH